MQSASLQSLSEMITVINFLFVSRDVLDYNIALPGIGIGNNILAPEVPTAGENEISHDSGVLLNSER